MASGAPSAFPANNYDINKNNAYYIVRVEDISCNFQSQTTFNTRVNIMMCAFDQEQTTNYIKSEIDTPFRVKRDENVIYRDRKYRHILLY